MEEIKGLFEQYRTGRIIRDPKISQPDEEKAILLEKLRRNLGVSCLGHTFENWHHSPQSGVAYRAALALATRDDARPFLMIYGGVGNGKTYLAEAISIALYKRGLFARVNTMSLLMGTLKNAMNKDAKEPVDVILSRLRNSPRLIIDDVGMGGSGSDWEWGQLEDIVCYRYQERLMTVVTTNKDPADMPKRIVSRFLDKDVAYCVLNDAPDYRRMK